MSTRNVGEDDVTQQRLGVEQQTRGVFALQSVESARRATASKKVYNQSDIPVYCGFGIGIQSNPGILSLLFKS